MPSRLRPLFALTLCSCGGSPDAADGGALDATAEGPEPCGLAGPTVVSDVDETLTTGDMEFVNQLVDGTYNPAMRAGGPGLLSAYHDLGYYVLYLTSRSEEMVLGGTGESARDGTERWLSEHGFPLDRARIVLAPTNADVAGEPARAYKAAALEEMKVEGHMFEYAYGNADTDILAYDDAGIPKSRTFIIGPLAGSDGTVPVPGEGWSEHADEHVAQVPTVCIP